MTDNEMINTLRAFCETDRSEKLCLEAADHIESLLKQNYDLASALMQIQRMDDIKTMAVCYRFEFPYLLFESATTPTSVARVLLTHLADEEARFRNQSGTLSLDPGLASVPLRHIPHDTPIPKTNLRGEK